MVREGDTMNRILVGLDGSESERHVLDTADAVEDGTDGIERHIDPGPPIIGNAYDHDRPPLPVDLRIWIEGTCRTQVSSTTVPESVITPREFTIRQSISS